MPTKGFLLYLEEHGQKHRTYLIMILDDYSRMIVGGHLFYQENAYNFQKVLKDAIATYGIPNKLYVDSGAPYKNRQLESGFGKSQMFKSIQERLYYLYKEKSSHLSAFWMKHST